MINLLAPVVAITTKFVNIRNSSLTLPGGESFSSLGMVAAFFSTPSGLHSPTLRFLQMPLELLVTEQSSRVTGFQPVSPSCRFHSHPDSPAAPPGFGTLLLDKCHLYLTQDLAPSTSKVYASAQRRFLDFCAQDNSLSPLGSALPASEDLLIRFCYLVDTLHHSSIKVYLSAIRLLHIDEGLPSPLVGCLQLHVLWGIKCHQGSNRRQRKPITMKLMHIIFSSLNFSDYNHTMLWVACCLGFFWFHARW